MTTATAVQKLVLDEVTMEQVGAGMRRQLICGQQMMLARISLAAGVSVPQHQHANEQITYLLAGEMEFRFGDDGADLRHIGAGEILVIPGDMPHSANVLADAEVIELFAPPRQDWIDGTDRYLRAASDSRAIVN
ncbi:MAG: cupin domain-containing protein [Proteobacteria bacterium]|nr:cupin domain-containing protein [Pseudomonadota bacterium]